MTKSTKELLLNKLQIIGFIAYFMILTGERLSAVILSYSRGGAYSLASGGFFPYAAYIVTCLSLVAGVALYLRPVLSAAEKLLSREKYDFAKNYDILILAAVVLLFGGMMHTGQTLPALQFTAYGFLILAMLVRCIEACMAGVSKFASIVSFVYLTLFSMCIPVCYMTNLTAPRSVLFYIAEFAAVFVLLPCFGKMLMNYFKNGVSTFAVCMPLIMLVLCGLTVGLKWTDEINWFVLIFAALTTVVYFTLGLVAKKRIR